MNLIKGKMHDYNYTFSITYQNVLMVRTSTNYCDYLRFDNNIIFKNILKYLVVNFVIELGRLV